MLYALLSVIAIPIGLYLVVVYCYQKWSRFFTMLKAIPGPTGLPIFGDVLNSLKPHDELFKQDRQRGLEYFPIFQFSLINVGVVLLLLPEDVELILSSPRHLKKARVYDLIQPWLGTGLLTSTGKKWQKRRKILTPAFHFTILQEFINIFNKDTRQLIDDLSARVNEPYIDVKIPITEMTLSAITETSMGVTLDSDTEINRNYKKAVNDFGNSVPYRIGRPWFFSPFIFRHLSKFGREFDRTVETLHNFSTNIIEKKKKAPQSTSYASRKKLAMLDLLLKAQANGENIDDGGIREEVDTFMFEGHDTTSVALCFIFMLLANQPKYQEEIHQEIVDVLGEDLDKEPDNNDLQALSYTERCIKECLRLYPSVPGIARQIAEDVVTKSGYVLPKGVNIAVPIYDIHRSPHLYPDPEKFDPDRFLPENVKSRHPFAYIPFSAGPRNCIGQKFAMYELKAVLCGVLRKFKLEPVSTPEDMVFVTDLVLRTTNEIRVKFTPRL